MTLAGLKRFSRHPEVIQQLRRGTSAVCPQDSLQRFSAGPLREVLESECLAECVAAVEERVTEEDCASSEGPNIDDMQLASDARCAGVAADTVQGLKEFVINKCRKWHAPTPLWVTEDKAPHDLNAEDGAGTCSGSSKPTIKRAGQCPEGSKCKCPRTYLRSRDSAEGLREKAYAEDSADAPSTTLAGSFERKTPFFSLGKGITSWSCKETVGCWPQRPEKTSTPTTRRACRMPAKAQDGGSELWFLPPPMLRLKHSWGKCVLEVCKPEHVAAQQVGFVASSKTSKYPGKANVYNCQPMAYDEMTAKQKVDFLDALRISGVFEEYDEPPPPEQQPIPED